MATVTPATEDSIKLWLKVGNLKKLEQAVLDGYSDQLRGRNSRIPKINKFLKRVPHFQAKISAIHAAASTGNLRELENLLDRKGLVLGRDARGATPLHTAVHQKQPEVVKYIVDAYPAVVHARDHQGRTPLHYAALTGDQNIFDMLVGAGADKEAKDTMGNTVKDYSQNPEEFQVSRLSSSRWLNKHNSREVTSLLRQPSPISPMTKSEIRAMIQRGDIVKLEKVILQGYGDSLVGETAISTRVRDLLDSVPDHLLKLRALDDAIESGSTRKVQNLINRKGLVMARDAQGLTVFHKAVIHGQKDIVKYLIKECPKAVFAKDHDKRTPVHYAAVLQDDGEIYDLLVTAGGNTLLPDCDGHTPEFYRLNPDSLNLARVFERKSAGSGKLSHSTSNGGLAKTTSTKSGKRDQSGGTSESTSLVKQWLRSGDIERLEKAVVDGHGLKLIRETTSDPRGRAFLRTVPVYMTKIGMIHEAVSQGSLRNLKVHLDRKKLAMSRDQLGLGLLHKAVLYNHPDIVQYLLDTYPETVHVRDKVGRTALHYAAVVKDKDTLYPLLLERGADPSIVDTKGNTAEHYYSNVDDLDVNEILNRVNRQRNRANNAGNQFNVNPRPAHQEPTVFTINGANIRKWIHSEDIAKLEQVVLEGQGYKLILETSNNARVKQFLVSVPSIVNRIREIHNAVVVGDLQGVESAIERPTLLVSKDEFGMTPLHKSVLLEQDEMTRFIATTTPASLLVKDGEGRTALHYAAGLKDSGKTYEILCRLGADPSVLDIRGKSADHYLTHQGELDTRQLMAHVNRCKTAATTGKNNDNTSTASIKRQVAPGNLRPVHKANTNGGVTAEAIAKIIQLGDLDKLDQLVLDGHGKRLLGKSSWNEDVRNFLKKVPHCMDKIYAIHMASASGDLILLQQLLDRKKFVLSRDEYGHTALHKAVKYGQMDVVKYLLQTVPSSHAIKDQDGRTPLHYAAMYKDRGAIYDLLVASGAQPKVQDQRGKSAEYYYASLTKLESPIPPKPLERIGHGGPGSEDRDSGSGSIDLSPDEDKQISSWIDNGDINELENLVLDGQGEKLLGKSSDNSKTQEFLEAVPALMGKIRAVHNAAANGDVKDLQSLASVTGSDVLALSRDEHGACPLHKAVLYGHHNAMKFLATNYPASLKIQDNTGLTSLHYAALVSSDGYFYRLLHNFGADPNAKDHNGFTPGQILRGNGLITGEELFKRYEEKRVPPRPHSVQTWERPPTEEILRALTPSPMTFGPITPGLSDQSEKSGKQNGGSPASEIKTENSVNKENEDGKVVAMLVKNEDDIVSLEENSAHYNVTTARKSVEGEYGDDEDIVDSESNSDNMQSDNLTTTDSDKLTTSATLDNLTATAPYETYDEIPVDNESLEADGTESELDNAETRQQLQSGSPSRRSPDGAERKGDGESEHNESSDELQQAALVGSDSVSMVDIDNIENESEVRLLEPLEEDEEEEKEEKNIDKLGDGDAGYNIDEIDSADVFKSGDKLSRDDENINNVDSPVENIDIADNMDDLKESNESEDDDETNNSGRKTADIADITGKDDEMPEEDNKVAEGDGMGSFDASGDVDKENNEMEVAQYESEQPNGVSDMNDLDKQDDNDGNKDIDKIDDEEKMSDPNNLSNIEAISELDRLENIDSSEIFEAKHELRRDNDETDSRLENESSDVAQPDNNENGDVVEKLDSEQESNVENDESGENDGNAEENKNSVSGGDDTPEPEIIEPMRAEALTRQLSEEDSDQVVIGKPLDSQSITGSTNTVLSTDAEELQEDSENDKDAVKTMDNQDEVTMVASAPPESDIEPSLDAESLVEESNNNNSTAFDLFKNASPDGDGSINPMHWTKEGEYLSAVLGDALITALAEVSRTRPEDPVAYLSLLLYRYIHKSTAAATTSSGSDESLKNGIIQPTEKQNGSSQLSPRSRLLSDDGGTIDLEELSKIKASDGSNIVHFAASLKHDDNDSFFELLDQSNYNVAERDARFRTARDVANELGRTSNASNVDRYIFHRFRQLPVSHAAGFLDQLILEGYDHLLDIVDDEGNDLIMVAELTQNVEAARLLKGAQEFQNRVELLHEHIRNDNQETIIELLDSDSRLGLAKNAKGQTAMHLAVLRENENIVETITKSTSAVVNEQDNMGRTPLHYAMGTTNPQVLAKIIIKQGGNQFSRDATSHMPSFYFINNSEIQKLKDELEEISI